MSSVLLFPVAVLLLLLLAGGDVVHAYKKSYIVYLGAHSYGREASAQEHARASESHHHLLASFLGGSADMARDSIFYSYTRNINGFAAYLEEQVAARIAGHPDVVTVLESRMLKLHTTRSWDFMDMERNGEVLPDSIWKRARFGRDVVIASLDSGVWPESSSFADDGDFEVPRRWKGSCDDTVKHGVPCNRKLIGAKHFNRDMLLSNPGAVDANWTRDTEGHGTHTLSTAGGAFVPRASLFGYANGTAKGGAPQARVAAYKVCWAGECAAADVLAGFEAAIHDGADVISVSFGQDDAPLADDARSLFQEPVTLGSLHAAVQGIAVVCSAGNSGPYDDTVVNGAPWVTTVAATTVDRDFPNVVTLGNSVRIKGMSLESTALHSSTLYPVVDARRAGRAGYDAASCRAGTLDPEAVRGKIVVCRRGGDVSRVGKGMAVLAAGGAGMILANGRMDGEDIVADPHVLPATMITYSEAVTLFGYLQDAGGSAVANISPSRTELGVRNAPSVAGFSSRGPSGTLPYVVKPDVAAPGVDILAAFTEYVGPTELASDKRRSEYAILSGTSMACPHVSGVMALLKAARPEWSPAAMRSAVMTTARTQDNTGAPMRDHDGKEANAFAYGAGNVHPNRAVDPGLVYDAGPADYFTFLCSMGLSTADLERLAKVRFACPADKVALEDLNYPSMVVPSLRGTQTVTRRLKNVGRPGKYLASWRAPVGISMEVKPAVLEFSKVGEEKEFKVTVTSQPDKLGLGYVFGRLVWTDGTHYVRSPVVVNALA